MPIGDSLNDVAHPSCLVKRASAFKLDSDVLVAHMCARAQTRRWRAGKLDVWVGARHAPASHFCGANAHLIQHMDLCRATRYSDESPCIICIFTTHF